MGREAKTAVPALTDLLREKGTAARGWSPVRGVAAEVLGHVGPEAEPAIPALTELLRDEDEEVREAAAEALGKIKREKKGGDTHR
jgi:HEAT repeat protein